MGRRRTRLIVQADLTSEEDQEFVAWVLGLRKRRRLAEVIRQGLKQVYEGQGARAPVPVEAPTVLPEIRIAPTEPAGGQASADKVKRLITGF